jgi:hypothetical protein
VRDHDLLSRLYFNMARVWSARGDKSRARQAAEAAVAVEKAAGAPTSITDRALALLAQ